MDHVAGDGKPSIANSAGATEATLAEICTSDCLSILWHYRLASCLGRRWSSASIVSHLNCIQSADFRQSKLGHSVEPSSGGVLVPLSGGCVLSKQVIDIGRKSNPPSYNWEHTGWTTRLNFRVIRTRPCPKTPFLSDFVGISGFPAV
jgi:hypothetical protein